MPATIPSGKHIVLNGNLCWDFWNFRRGLISAMLQRGFRVTVMAMPDDTAIHLEAMGCQIEPVDFQRGTTNPFADLMLLALYRRALARIRPDLQISFMVKPVIYGGLAARLCKIPSAAVVTGLGSPLIAGGWLGRLVRGLYRAGLKSAHKVFFLNDEDHHYFAANRMVDSGVAGVLPGEGVDVTAFGLTPLPDASTTTFLFVGRLLRDKGILEFVEAARRMKVECPNTRFQVLGAIDRQNPTAVTEQDVAEWGASGIIDYLGVVSDVRPHVAAAHCVVLPSYREGVPRSLLEAAAMGRALIATDVPGCRLVVRNGENGWSCRPRDAADLADRMLAAAKSDRTVLADMGQRGRERVVAEFSNDVVNGHYFQFLADFFARPGDRLGDRVKVA